MSNFRAYILLAALLLGGAASRAEEWGELRHDVPAGVDENDPDRARFRLGRDPLRSFESDAEGWQIESWPDEAGLGEPTAVAAECVAGSATEGACSLQIPLKLPAPSVVFKHASVGEYCYITYDVFLPEGAPGRIRTLFWVKGKDGHWFQAMSGRPFVRDGSGRLVAAPSEHRLVAGTWNTVTVDLRAASAGLQAQGHLARWQELFARDTEYLGFAIFGDEPYAGVAYLDNLRGWKLAEPVDDLAVRNLSFPRTGTKTYDLFEIAFDLNRTFEDPFDPRTIQVDAVFTAPSGAEVKVPGFYYQGFQRRLTVSGEQMLPAGAGSWAVRYAPREAGRHLFRLLVAAGYAKLTTDERSFDVGLSDHAGYVRISPRDRRCFEFESGAPYYPIGHNFRSPNDPRCSFVLGWPLSPDEGTFTYDRILERMAAGGENFVEVWLASWWAALEWTRAWKGYHGLGQYNLANAWRIDHVLRRARELGLRVQLVIDNHGKYSSWCDREWQDSPYNVANRSSGGFLQRPEQFFTEEEAKRLYRQKVRYLFARWGWDPTIMGFEVVSELDLTGSRHGIIGRRHGMDGEGAPLRMEHLWHKEMIAYFKSVDSGSHLYTTHYSGDYNTVDPVMVRLGEIDYVVGDGYRSDDDPFARLAYASAVNHEKFGKPFIITEYGGGWNGTSDPGLVADLHSGLWGSYMTSAAGSPLLWWFDFIDRRDLYGHFKAFAAYAAGEDRRDTALAMRTPAIERKPDEVDLAAMAYMSRARGYAWVYAVEAMSRYPIRPIAIGGVSLRFDDVEDGPWQVGLWDTVAGTVARRRRLTATGGRLALELPGFDNDVALKLRRIDPAAAAGPDEASADWDEAVARGRLAEVVPASVNTVLGFDAGRDAADRARFVGGWAVLGPFPYERAKWPQTPDMDFVGDERSLVPELEGERGGKRWKAAERREGEPAGHVDLDAIFGGMDSAVAYAAAILDCDREYPDLVLLAGSDDTMKVYLNGEPIHTAAATRGAVADQDRVERVALRTGRNVLVVKCADIGGGWGFFVRFVSRDNKPLFVRPAGR